MIRGSLSANKFSSIHGDLITEIFNGETKRNAGPCRAGCSSDPMKMNTWIKTSHLHATLQSALREKVSIATSLVHKELTSAGKKLHVLNVDNLKQMLEKYKFGPLDMVQHFI